MITVQGESMADIYRQLGISVTSTGLVVAGPIGNSGKTEQHDIKGKFTLAEFEEKKLNLFKKEDKAATVEVTDVQDAWKAKKAEGFTASDLGPILQSFKVEKISLLDPSDYQAAIDKINALTKTIFDEKLSEDDNEEPITLATLRTAWTEKKDAGTPPSKLRELLTKLNVEAISDLDKAQYKAALTAINKF